MNMRDYPTQTQTEVREPLVNIDIYGEKKVTYRDRYEVMNRSGIIINVNTFIYQLFNQFNTSFLSMWFRIIEQMHHTINNPSLVKPPRRQKEEFLIRELGSATPYGCNDKIDRTCIISSSTCSSWIRWICSTPLLRVDEAMVILIIHRLCSTICP